MDKVSVLVAVHNTACYLPMCLDSLTGQTLRDIQIICVDDASTDDSPAILDRYAAADSRVEVIHLAENVGMSKARNTALKQARGTYVCMLDSDDWYAPDALQQAVDVFERHPDTDCVLFRFVLAGERGDTFDLEDYPSKVFDVLSGADACRLSIDWQIHGIYMVRSDIHHRFPYDDTSMVYSDENTTRLHYAVSRKVRCCQGAYYYRQHQQSETHRVSVRRFDKLKAKESLMQQLSDVGVGFDARSVLTNQLWLALIDLYMFYFVHKKELSRAEADYGFSELRRVWSTIDRSLLSPTVVRKFGYWPMPSWRLFCIQEWLYFTLRGLLGKNN